MANRSFLTLFFVVVSLNVSSSDDSPINDTEPARRPLPQLYPRFGKLYEIDRKAVRTATKWDKDAENSPVSARNAIALATREIKRFDTTIKYDRTKNRWSFHSVELIPPRRHGNWYWLAKFNFESIPEEINRMAGIPEQVWIPVLMNGKVVKLTLPDPPGDIDPDGIDEMEELPSTTKN